MTGINRRGQKVRCEYGIAVFTDDMLPVKADVPKRGETYTVEDFKPTGRLLNGEEHGPGITLVEVSTAICGCCDQPMGWPIRAFRPIVEDERKTDISALVELTTKTPEVVS